MFGHIWLGYYTVCDFQCCSESVIAVFGCETSLGLCESVVASVYLWGHVMMCLQFFPRVFCVGTWSWKVLDSESCEQWLSIPWLGFQVKRRDIVTS